MKIKSLLTIALAVIMLFAAAGCKKNETTPTPSASASAEQTDLPDETQAPQETALPENYLKTEGGAVLVGKVGKNSDGEYCLILDNPITVELNYFIDHPEMFTNCTEILLYETEDEIDKSAYEDMDVTIKGVLQNYRGAGRLYVYVCYIEAERTVDKCYSDESIVIGGEVGFVPDYDPTKALPEKVLPKTENGVYVFNPYALNLSTIKQLGNSFADYYIDLVDAYLSFETSCPCPNEYFADMFPLLVTADFAYFQADGVIGDVVTYDDVAKTVNWTYSTDKATHDKLIADFETEVNKYLSTASETGSEVLNARNVYHSFCTSITYSYEMMETRKNVDAYHGIVNKTGICYTFAGAYYYLLTNIGVECKTVNASIIVDEGEDESGHAWNLVTMNGENYFCDPTYEASNNAGKDYLYFGMTLADRLNDGTAWDRETILVGLYDLSSIDEITMAPEHLNDVN